MPRNTEATNKDTKKKNVPDLDNELLNIINRKKDLEYFEKTKEQLLEEIQYFRGNIQEKKIKRDQEKEKLKNDLNKAIETFNKADIVFDDNDFKEAKNVKAGISWLKKFFSGIIGYFFGKKKFKDIDSEEVNIFSKVVENTNISIEKGLKELKEKPVEEQSRECIEKLENLQKTMRNTKDTVRGVQNELDNEKNINNPGALKGEALKTELTELCSFLSSAFNDYGSETNSLELFAFTMNLSKKLGLVPRCYDIPTGNMDFNSTKDIKDYLNDAIAQFERYGVKNDEDVLYNGKDEKTIFRDIVVKSILGPFKKKLDAIVANEKLIENGEKPIEYEKRQFVTEEMTDSFEIFASAKKIRELKEVVENMPVLDAIRTDMDDILEKIQNDIASGNTANKTKGTLQAFIYISNVYLAGSKNKKQFSDLQKAISTEGYLEGIEKSKADADEFMKRFNKDKIDEFKKIIEKDKVEKEAFDKKIKEECASVNDKLKAGKIKKEEAEESLKTINSKKYKGKFNAVFKAELQDFYDRKDILREFKLESDSLYQSISGELKGRYLAEKNNDANAKNFNTAQLKKHFQALLYVEEIIKDFDNLDTEVLDRKHTEDAIIEGMKKYEDKITDKLIVEMEKNLGDAIKNGNRTKTDAEVNFQLNKISGKDIVKPIL